MRYILALDQGTTSSRAILFDHDFRIVGIAQQEFSQHFPQPQWVEHDPLEIWQTQLQTSRDVLRNARIEPRQIAAIGISNQRETTVMWDRRTGDPVHRAIVWQDRRTAEMCDRLVRDGHAPAIQQKTGLVIDPYFSATKIRWLLDHVPDLRPRCERGEIAFGTIDTWLAWKLTGGRLHITDATNASRTMLYNIHTGDWDDDLLALLSIPRSILPQVRNSSEIYGECDVDLLGAAIPLAGIAGDQQAALFGQACFDPGMVKNTYGTGCFMLMNTGGKPVMSKHRLLTTVAWQLDGRRTYALEGSVFIGGAVVQWLRDQLGLIRKSADIEPLARSVPDNGGVYLVPAFAGLGAPHWDPYARGTITGLTRGTSAGHIARAALEGIAHQVADVIEVMQQDAAEPIAQLRADGGAAANDLLLQFQADMLGVQVLRPAVTETTALGAAALAGLAVGYWSSPDEIRHHWQIDRAFDPQMSADQRRAHRDGWRSALQRAKHRIGRESV
mgnify:CR=1 FL=1